MNFQEFLNKYQKVPVIHHSHQVKPEPKVSVAVQTYQHRDYIRKCLDGILMQETNFNFEILLGDDDSTDGTREICIEYAEKYSEKIRLFLHHRENNISIGGSATGRFNLLYNLYSSKGKYIALCEGDDYWTDPLKLETQVNFLRANKNYGATYHSCNSLTVENDEITIRPKWPKYYSFSSNDLQVGKGEMITSTVLFRNTLPSFTFDTEILNFDTYLWHCIGFIGSTKFIQGIKPSIYRKHEGGIWSMKNRYYKLLNGLDTYRLIFKNLQITGKDPSMIYPITIKMLNSYMVTQLSNRNFFNYLRGVKIFIFNNLIKKRLFLKFHLKFILKKIVTN